MEQTVSIIVPVYNAAKTLARCVDSLTGQTYENLEILLVNDGSRDESLSLCREYAAFRRISGLECEEPDTCELYH